MRRCSGARVVVQVNSEIQFSEANHVKSEREFHARLANVAKLADDSFDKFKKAQDRLTLAIAAGQRITMRCVAAAALSVLRVAGGRLESQEKARAHAERALTLIQHIKHFKTNPVSEFGFQSISSSFVSLILALLLA